MMYADSQRSDEIACLICRVREGLWAIPLAGIAETLRPLPVERLATMPPYVLGVSIIRGNAIPVVDAAALSSPGGHARITRLVVLKTENRFVALGVESVVGVQKIAGRLLTELPPLLRKDNAEIVASIAVLDESLLRVLETARLVPEEVWEAAASRGVA
jgi:purine-binding chemotaxis protein CheW